MLSRISAVAAALVLGSFCAFASAERTVDLKETVGPTVSPKQGTFALIDRKTNELQIFRSVDDAAPAQKATTGTDARVMIWKQVDDKGYYVIVAADAIYVHDDATAKQVAKITTTDGQPARLAPDPRPTSPWVYYSTDQRSNATDAYFGRLNLKTLKDEGTLEAVPGGELSRPMDMRIAPDGNTMYAWRVHSSPTGVQRYQISEPTEPNAKATLLRLRYLHDDWRDLVVDPGGRFVASNLELFPSDASKPIGRLSGTPVCALLERPVLFVVKGSVIDALSTNDFRALGSVNMTPLINFKPDPRRRPMPDQFDIPNGNHWYDGNKVIIAEADERIGRLVVRMRTTVFEIPLSSFKLPDEPVIAARIAARADADTGVAWTGEAKPIDPRVTLSLKSAPEGATFRDGKINWTPTQAQVGGQQFQFELAWNGVTVKQTLDVLVRRPSLSLPYRPEFFCVSPDGARTVMGRPGVDELYNPQVHSRRDKFSKVAQLLVVDNKTMTIIAQREMSEKVGGITMDNDRVYVGLRDVAAMKVLSAKDLSEQRQVFTKTQPQRLEIVGNALMTSGYGDGPVECFSLPDLKPQPLDRSEGAGHMNRSGNLLTMDDAVIYRGVEYDLKTLKPRALLDRGSTLGFGVTVGMDQFNGANRFTRASFGAYSGNGQIIRIGRSPIGLGDQMRSTATVLADFPAFASLLIESARPNGAADAQRTKISIAFRDLLSGKTLLTAVLADEPSPEQQGSYMQETCKLGAVPGTLIVTVFDRLYRIDTAELAKLNAPTPLSLKRKEGSQVIGATPGTLTWEVVGGKGPFHVELLDAPPGVTIADDKPVVKIDPKVFARDAIQQMWQGFTNYAGVPGTAEQRLEAYAVRERKRLADLLDVSLKQIPVVAALRLRVTDADNQTADVSYLAILDLPESAFKDVLEQARKQEQAADPRNRARTGGGNDSALQRRVEELERENEKLRAQVELLRDMVGNKAPTTRPTH